MKVKVLKEPLLEFGSGAHICPRTGIERLGVYDTRDADRRTELRLGIVGRGEGIDALDVWLEKCREGIEAKESKFPNLFKGFGGINEYYGFNTRLLSSPQFTRAIQKTAVTQITKIERREDRVSKAVDIFYDQVRFLAENRSVDVIVCVIPEDLYSALTTTDGGNDNDSIDEHLEYNFRRELKARCMHLSVPLQLTREKTISTVPVRGEQQDVATRAWNFCTALYYKGNRSVPWRLIEDSYKPRTCYVGVGFYWSRDRQTVSTSLAQVFDEFGHGVILRGTPVSIDKDDRRPYMDAQQAGALLGQALEEYEKALSQTPARVVVHKSSRFRQSELDGFHQSLDSARVQHRDFVSITNTHLRLFSNKEYPPVRGTLLEMSETEGLLYTRGLVEFYKTYPGMYVPNPLKINVVDNDSSLEELCFEILGLTKMNWNNTQLDGRLPITLECAGKVGDIMKYLSSNDRPQVSYGFYM